MHNEEKICNEILELDSSIRFAGIANKMGKLSSRHNSLEEWKRY